MAIALSCSPMMRQRSKPAPPRAISGAASWPSPAGTSTTNLVVALNAHAGGASLPTLSDIIGDDIGPFTALNNAAGWPNAQQLATGVGRISLSSLSTVYLVGTATFTGASPTAYG